MLNRWMVVRQTYELASLHWYEEDYENDLQKWERCASP